MERIITEADFKHEMWLKEAREIRRLCESYTKRKNKTLGKYLDEEIPKLFNDLLAINEPAIQELRRKKSEPLRS